MNRIISFICISFLQILLFTSILSAQTYRGFGCTKKGCYMIDETNQRVSPKNFDDAKGFYSGIALCNIKGRYHYINMHGESISGDPDFDFFKRFSENCARVHVSKGKDHWTWIDTTGKKITDKMFDIVGDFHEGLAYARERRSKDFGYINEKGEWAIEPQFRKCYDFIGNFAYADGGYITKEGKKIKLPKDAYALETGGFSHIYHDISVQWVSRKSDCFNDSTILLPVMKFFKWGYVNGDGEVVVPFKYKEANFFYEGRAVVKPYDDKDFRIIDEKGEYITDKTFMVCEGYKEGFAYANDRNVRCYVDRYGNYLKYDEKVWPINQFNEGFALVLIKGEEYGRNFINTKGEILCDQQFRRATDFKDGFADFEVDNRWGVIDTTGKIVIPPIYEKAVKLSMVKP